MTNLLQETLSILKDHDKTSDDVLWVGSPDHGYMSWKNYAAIADKEYYDGYGVQEVAGDLVVVGNSWWLERGEYDGSEWWEYKELPVKPLHRRAFKTVINRPWGILRGYE